MQSIGSASRSMQWPSKLDGESRGRLDRSNRAPIKGFETISTRRVPQLCNLPYCKSFSVLFMSKELRVTPKIFSFIPMLPHTTLQPNANAFLHDHDLPSKKGKGKALSSPFPSVSFRPMTRHYKVLIPTQLFHGEIFLLSPSLSPYPTTHNSRRHRCSTQTNGPPTNQLLEQNKQQWHPTLKPRLTALRCTSSNPHSPMSKLACSTALSPPWISRRVTSLRRV